MKVCFEGAIFGELVQKHSERAHFDHSYKPATILKICCVRDVYPGTWSKFTKQRTFADVCQAKGIEVLTQWCSLTL